MKIAILTLGSRGDVQPYVALGKKAIEVYCNHFKAIERKTQWLVFWRKPYISMAIKAYPS